MNKFFMTMLMLVPVVEVHGRSTSLGDESLNQQLPVSHKENSDVTVLKTSGKGFNKKAVKKLAAIVVGKDSIKQLYGYIDRSKGPAKQLLHDLLLDCDFHKHQLEGLKRYIQELQALLDESIPLSTRMLFMYVSHPHVQEFFGSLVHYEGDAGEQAQVLPYSHIVCEDAVEFLAEKDPQLYAALLTQWQKWRLFHEQWQDFLADIVEYVSGRVKQRQKYVEEHIQAFSRAMIWKHLGPTLGLMIRVWWHKRKLNMQEYGDDIIIAFMQEIYAQMITRQSMHQKEMDQRARQAVREYSAMILAEFDLQLKRLG